MLTLTIGACVALLLVGVLVGAGGMMAIVISLGRPDADD